MVSNQQVSNAYSCFCQRTASTPVEPLDSSSPYQEHQSGSGAHLDYNYGFCTAFSSATGGTDHLHWLLCQDNGKLKQAWMYRVRETVGTEHA
jgi:hypothetical protein